MMATKTSNRFVLVEALATALYVYFAGAVVCATGNASFDVLLPVRVVAIALGHGAAYGIMVHWTLLVERSEGVGFLNPAVTLALATFDHATGRRYEGRDVPLRRLCGARRGEACGCAIPGKLVRAASLIAAQLVGAVAGGLLLAGSVPGSASAAVPLGAPFLGHGSTAESALFFEISGGTLLAWALLVASRKRSFASRHVAVPLVAALCVAALTLCCFPFTGGCFNPLRALAPALIAGHLPSGSWVFVVGPTLGALVGALFYALVFTNEHLLCDVCDGRTRKEGAEHGD